VCCSPDVSWSSPAVNTPSKNDRVCIQNTTPSKRPTTPTTPKNTRKSARTPPLPAGDSRLPWRRRAYNRGVHLRLVYRRSRVTHAYIAPPRNRHVADTRAAAVVSAGAVCVVGLHAIDCARVPA